MSPLLLMNEFIKVANNLLDFVFLWGGLFLILQYPIRYISKGMDKYDKEQREGSRNPGSQDILRELLSQFFILLIATLFFGFCWLLPELAKFFYPDRFGGIPGTYWRLGMIFFLAFIMVYIFGHEHGERRWLTSYFGHAAIIFTGLVLDGWMGVIFISLPVLLAYYITLYRLAMVIVPTNNPEDPAERRKRFLILVAYAWGIQFPMVVVPDHAWKKPETRIPGDFTWSYPVPGVVWTKAHQVVAVTGGTRFKRVDGPGLVFTGQLERAEQIFDLRLQLRSNAIDVVTKDGISLKVVVFTAFRLDPEEWDEELYKKLRTANPLLRGAKSPSFRKGSFPFSALRVRAALGVTSKKPGVPDSTLYWDQWALNVVEDQARKVISQKKLDELWRLPEDKDKRYANALDVIADEIKTGAAPILRDNGILVFVSRVVNFSFVKDGQNDEDFSMQQINNWVAERKAKSSTILAKATAEAKSMQHDARAYAASLMLKAIEDGMRATNQIDLNLPPHITAMLFSALQDYIDKLQEDDPEENEKDSSSGSFSPPYLPQKDKKP